MLGPKDDIVFFEYSKKTSRERGPALVGLEISAKTHFPGLLQRLDDSSFSYTYVYDNPELFAYLV